MCGLLGGAKAVGLQEDGLKLLVRILESGQIVADRVLDPYTLYTDPDPAFSTNVGSGSWIRIFSVNFFQYIFFDILNQFF